MKSALLLAAVALASLATPSLAATVNVDAFSNASLNGDFAVNVALAAGTYNVKFVQDAFTAATRFSSVSGCDGSGKNCSTGYENSVSYNIGGTLFGLGDGASLGGIGPISPGDAYYSDAATSFLNSGAYTAKFTLASAQTVGFFFYDDYLGDNSGGVSLNISAAVPEVATWGMLLVGFGALGAAARRRRATTVRFA